MWLKVKYIEKFPDWPVDPVKIKVSIEDSELIPFEPSGSYRVSPIFSLVRNNSYKPDLTECSIYFICYPNPFRALAIIMKEADKDLHKNVWFSIGLSSVIIFDRPSNSKIKDILDKVNQEPRATEKWEVRNAFLTSNPEFEVVEQRQFENMDFSISDYSKLDKVDITTVDEFAANITLLLSKISFYFDSELSTFSRIVSEINELIEEISYLHQPEGERPATLIKYSDEELLNKDLINRIHRQNMDRITQVNAALVYVSTQALSGATPILERRSLIRRHSLLGIGGAILTLNRLARKIELAFAAVPIENIVKDFFTEMPPISGLHQYGVYDFSNWADSSLESLESRKDILPRDHHPKLPYFSGRLGFRETEYTISAAIQSLSNGAGLDWSLLTLTHEMVHGHVRILITSLFNYPSNMTEDQRYNYFFERYIQKLEGDSIKDERYIDSLRYLILSYCSLSYYCGSITRTTEDGYSHGRLTDKEKLKNQFSLEYRNISEIMVHILDLNYFYAGRLSSYIPLIWNSWISIPQVSGDLRQYILRSLLTISSKIDAPDPHTRFGLSVNKLLGYLESSIPGNLKETPLIINMVRDLSDDDKKKHSFYPAFRCSLYIVDMCSKLLFSRKIKAQLISDPLVFRKPSEHELEDSFQYILPDGFQDEIIESPTAYLLHKMVSTLESDNGNSDIEWETAFTLLACNSS